MKYKNLDNGSIYDVTDETQIPSYEANPRFERIDEKTQSSRTVSDKAQNVAPDIDGAEDKPKRTGKTTRKSL